MMLRTTEGKGVLTQRTLGLAPRTDPAHDLRCKLNLLGLACSRAGQSSGRKSKPLVEDTGAHQEHQDRITGDA
jgi:hypothetical protein